MTVLKEETMESFCVRLSGGSYDAHSWTGDHQCSYVEKELDIVLREAMFTRAARALRLSLWPDDPEEAAAVPLVSYEQELNRALEALHFACPDWACLIVGKGALQDAFLRFLRSLSSPVLNRHLVFTLLDYSVALLVPELSR